VPPNDKRFRLLDCPGYCHDGLILQVGMVVATTRDLTSGMYGATWVRVPDSTPADVTFLAPEFQKIAIRNNPDGTTTDTRWRPPYDKLPLY
jgi:hypothetical protein